MSSENSTEEIVRQLKAFAYQFTKGLAPENLITCEELWKLMNESDEYILLVDTRSDVEISVSKIKGAITYVISFYLRVTSRQNIWRGWIMRTFPLLKLYAIQQSAKGVAM